MIISRTPYRISFFGGGTDYPLWYRRHGGAVLVTTINKYCYLTCRYLPPFFDYRHLIVWSQIERVSSVAEIQHPSVRETLRFLRITEGVEIHHDGDLPARTGLGSSSAFTVGLLHGLYALRGVMPSKARLAREAIVIEQDRLKECVGSQDQIAAAVGGMNRIDFKPDGEFRVSPLVIPRARLEVLQDHLMLLFTGISRTASEIVRTQLDAMPAKIRELAALQQMVDEGVDVLTGAGDLERFGALLHEAWQVKRSLTDRISTPVIDQMYEAARRAGALGGKLLGAGGGGFLLLFVRPQQQAKGARALKQLLQVPFRFEDGGSRIIFYDSESVESQQRQERPRRSTRRTVAPLAVAASSR